MASTYRRQFAAETLNRQFSYTPSVTADLAVRLDKMKAPRERRWDSFRFFWDNLISVAASTTTATAAATASATAGTFGLGPRLVDVDGATAHLRTIQRGNCFVSVLVAGHLHEAETAGAPRITVRHDANPVHLPEMFEQGPKFVFVCVEAQISNKNILHASASALSCRKCKQFGGLGRSGGPS